MTPQTSEKTIAFCEKEHKCTQHIVIVRGDYEIFRCCNCGAEKSYKVR